MSDFLGAVEGTTEKRRAKHNFKQNEVQTTVTENSRAACTCWERMLYKQEVRGGNYKTSDQRVAVSKFHLKHRVY